MLIIVPRKLMQSFPTISEEEASLLFSAINLSEEPITKAVWLTEHTPESLDRCLATPKDSNLFGANDEDSAAESTQD